MKRALTAAPIFALLLLSARASAHEPNGGRADEDAGMDDDEPWPCMQNGAPCPEAGAEGGGDDADEDAGEGGWHDGGWEPGYGVRIVPIAQYRLRFRHEEGRDFQAGDPIRNTFRHRVRAGLRATWEDKVGATIEVQDARTYGEEKSTTDGVANGIDLHQGYAILRPVKGLEMRLGRQEIGYLNERLVGRSDWSEEARAFDALRVVFEKDGLHADAFYARVRDPAPGTGSGSDGFTDFTNHAHFGGFAVRDQLFAEFAPAVMGTVDVDDASGSRHVTVGALVDGDIEEVASYALEGYYQFGRSSAALTHSAYMLGLRVRGTFPVTSRPYIESFANFSSGDSDPTDLVDGTFASPQGTAHKFYGAMDVFTNLPRDTQNRGLREVGAALGCSPVEGMSIRSSVHVFQAMASRDTSNLVTFGEELDHVFEFRFWEHAAVDLGYAFFIPQQILRENVPDPVLEHFLYSTVDVSF